MKILTSITLAAAVFLPSCRSAPPPEPGLELRLYDVPKGTAVSLAATVKDVLWMNEYTGGASAGKAVGRAVATPDGRLAVLATPNVHAGVQALVDEVVKHPQAQTPSDQSIEIHYFIVYGRPAASAQPIPPGAAEIKPALDEIARTVGPQTFTVAQHAQLTSLQGDDGKLTDSEAQLEIHQKPTQTNEGVFAMIGVNWKSYKLETKVRLAPDKIVVLGATGEKSTDKAAADGGEKATLYYVVRVAPRPDGQRP